MGVEGGGYVMGHGKILIPSELRAKYRSVEA
jgi:hypothetical protein